MGGKIFLKKKKKEKKEEREGKRKERGISLSKEAEVQWPHG